MSNDLKQQWMTRVLESGLSNGVILPHHVLEHATPNVLAQHLPPELMASLLQNSLKAGSLTPDSLIDTLGAAGLAAHLPHELVWNITVSAVEGTTQTDGSEGTLQQRTFLGAMLASAVEIEVVTASAILQHATPTLIMQHMPLPMRAHILEQCLESQSMTPARLIEIIEPPVLAHHLPIDVIWRAICTCDFEDMDIDLDLETLELAEVKTSEPAPPKEVAPPFEAEAPVRRKITPAPARRRMRPPGSNR